MAFVIFIYCKSLEWVCFQRNVTHFPPEFLTPERSCWWCKHWTISLLRRPFTILGGGKKKSASISGFFSSWGMLLLYQSRTHNHLLFQEFWRIEYSHVERHRDRIKVCEERLDLSYYVIKKKTGRRQRGTLCKQTQFCFSHTSALKLLEKFLKV